VVFQFENVSKRKSRNCRDILIMPRGAVGVHPHEDFRARRDRAEARAGGGFCFGRDRVFKVDDYGIGSG